MFSKQNKNSTSLENASTYDQQHFVVPADAQKNVDVDDSYSCSTVTNTCVHQYTVHSRNAEHEAWCWWQTDRQT